MYQMNVAKISIQIESKKPKMMQKFRSAWIVKHVSG